MVGRDQREGQKQAQKQRSELDSKWDQIFQPSYKQLLRDLSLPDLSDWSLRKQILMPSLKTSKYKGELLVMNIFLRKSAAMIQMSTPKPHSHSMGLSPPEKKFKLLKTI